MKIRQIVCFLALLPITIPVFLSPNVPDKNTPLQDPAENVVFSGKPIQGRLTAEAVEKFRLRSNTLGEGQYIEINDYAISPVDGSIYLLDAKEFTLHVFDPAGKHVRAIRIPRGQGPGELGGQFPLSNKAYPRKEGLWAEDFGEIALFDHQGRIVKKKGKGSAGYSQILGISPESLLVVKDERGTFDKTNPNRAFPGVQHFDLENWAGQTVARFFSSAKTGGWGNAWVNHVRDYRITPLIVFDYDGESRRVVYASSDEYALTVKDLGGKTLQTIRRDFTPRKITPAMRETVMASPYFQNLLSMMKKNGEDFQKMMNMNQTWGHLNPLIKIQFLADIFDRQGRWRITLQFPEAVQKLKNPRLQGIRLAGLEIDEDGESQYVEYILKNLPAEFIDTNIGQISGTHYSIPK
jgi:hypothetical protein